MTDFEKAMLAGAVVASLPPVERADFDESVKKLNGELFRIDLERATYTRLLELADRIIARGPIKPEERKQP